MSVTLSICMCINSRLSSKRCIRSHIRNKIYIYIFNQYITLNLILLLSIFILFLERWLEDLIEKNSSVFPSLFFIILFSFQRIWKTKRKFNDDDDDVIIIIFHIITFFHSCIRAYNLSNFSHSWSIVVCIFLDKIFI